MDPIEYALAELARGRPVVVADGEDRENEGDLIVAADRVTTETMAFIVRHSSGFVCVALPDAECARLALPPMYHSNNDHFGTAYRVTVDAASGVSTGISARDRARTARVLADPATRPGDLTRPGHVVPLAARPGGVLERPGHTEAAVDLARLAGLRPAGVLCEVVSERDPSRMARRPELAAFAAEHGLALITIDSLVAFRRATEAAAERVVGVRLPTGSGVLRTVGYRGLPDGAEHVALVAGASDGRDIPVHVHVECVPGDVFGSNGCDCAARLDAAVREVTAARRGIVVYLRPRVGDPLRGLFDERHRVGCGPAELAVAASILTDLGVTSLRHLQNPVAVRGGLDAAFAAAVRREAAEAPGAVA
ncbi:3,4-dihydroxy 2-butanone 4-phosphate synthase/GTP cyclohydrolase II [Amycolatopsis sulphurea]|uniref:3,4-dihydroxy-2-butanone 4-phosphate synthase n=1 Tax=Amycolatopsis sulphurea TaxID=76022 RepID=A0A2A9FEQ1_9PSEU|nr:3,4-dihydroxy-2-butanone-4-phosphate synthase [Amycolatopsis sulphurea]PFG49927.1 3,4-dihydroxy 2-butanone 4-phosphate synthase/GTP cyclohydrolase II [Amycolatopsis sulphurea]